ncbi:hypothetical protein [Pseudomonas sp. SCB32]|uniref:hypothetical protein n=1 Tax=Pseudomonas sp. SCB32 TaxID=2653853 RepID=UPI001264FFFB|nr:hypothetical protein [Pseudomonas sp. SCB32]
MESTVRDHRIAALIPIAVLAVSVATLWSLPFLMLAYLVLRPVMPLFVRAVFLCTLDLVLSLLLLAVAVWVLAWALVSVVGVGGGHWLSQFSLPLVLVLTFFICVYGVLHLVLAAYGAWCWWPRMTGRCVSRSAMGWKAPFLMSRPVASSATRWPRRFARVTSPVASNVL